MDESPFFFHVLKYNEQIISTKLQWNAKSKIGSLENATHKPGGGNLKIEEVKVDFRAKAKPKIGSLDNATHQPGGGDVKVRFIVLSVYCSILFIFVVLTV